MNETRIEVDQGQTAFEPGAELTGKVSWRLEKQPRSVELRLFWLTRGKGTEDVVIVQVVPFTQAQPEEVRPFRLTLPVAPYSFSGKLISLIWALELVAEPSRTVARQEFVLGPGAREVHLDSVVPMPRGSSGLSLTFR